MRSTIGLGLLVVTLAVLMAGCGGGSNSTAQGSNNTKTGAAFDRAFIDGMVPHHEEAIAMARKALASGLTAPELVTIAKAIVETQQDEIDRMKAWRNEWY